MFGAALSGPTTADIQTKNSHHKRNDCFISYHVHYPTSNISVVQNQGSHLYSKDSSQGAGGPSSGNAAARCSARKSWCRKACMRSDCPYCGYSSSTGQDTSPCKTFFTENIVIKIENRVIKSRFCIFKRLAKTSFVKNNYRNRVNQIRCAIKATFFSRQCYHTKVMATNVSEQESYQNMVINKYTVRISQESYQNNVITRR